MTAAPNTFQGYGLVYMHDSIAPLSPVPGNGVKDGLAGTGTTTVQTLTLPAGLDNLVVTLAYTDLSGASPQNIIKLAVQVGGTTIQPLQPNDPLGQSPPIPFAQSNVAKVVVKY